MDPRFYHHNLHLKSISAFKKFDPNLGRLKGQPYVYYSNIINELPVDVPGVYTLGGGRQIGKTTLLKQWMLKLLEKEKIPANNIAFISGELVDDHHVLYSLLEEQIHQMSEQQKLFLIIDEVTYIKDWDKAIKYAADINLLHNVTLLITGSDLLLMQKAKMRFPGRRGISDQVDFHLNALSFREVLKLKLNIQQDSKLLELKSEVLLQEFYRYLEHGGYLTAINDIAKYNEIKIATLKTYSEWIRGDILKNNKQEGYLKEIITAILKKSGSQVTWNALAKDLSIDSPKTIADYLELLSNMDAVFIQSATYHLIKT